MKAHIKNVRISPKKLNLVAKMIRGKNASEAMDILRFTNKKAADLLYKALKSAVANAENNEGFSRDQLTLDSLMITKGIVMKRINPVSRGRAHRILKRSSHVNVTLKSI